MNIGWWYLIIVATVAIPLSLFEVWGIKHFEIGWGEDLPQDTVWGKHLRLKLPGKAVGTQLQTRYHAVMYVFIVPLVVWRLGVRLQGWAALPPAHWLGWLLFAAAGMAGVMALEDFLFFTFSTIVSALLNKEYPYSHALRRTFHGEAEWHLQMPFFWGYRFPAIYIILPAIATLLLSAVIRFGR